MAEFEEISLTLADGSEAYGRYWSVGNPLGAVLYHHGIQSHCGWYEASAGCLANAGYAVLQVDRRGCGKNKKDRGHADSAEQLIAEAHVARNELARRSGLADHHVVGVSWGGKLAVASAVTHPAGVLSLSLVTPGLFPRVGVSKSQMAKIGFAMLYDKERLFDIPLDEPERFTSVSQWQQFIASDPLTLAQCTAGFYLASRRMDKIVAKLCEVSPIPVHLMLAGDERIIDNDKTADFVRTLHWRNCRITRYGDARHSLEFESDSDAYFADLVEFLTRAPKGI